MEKSKLRTGGVDNGGTMVAYPFEGREEVGWLYEIHGEMAQMDSFSGDYTVVHHAPLSSLQAIPASQMVSG